MGYYEIELFKITSDIENRTELYQGISDLLPSSKKQKKQNTKKIRRRARATLVVYFYLPFIFSLCLNKLDSVPCVKTEVRIEIWYLVPYQLGGNEL